MSGVGATITNVESSCRDTQFQLKELKDYVDHFADNLVLSSGQITVETDAGFNVKPRSLTETLKGARGTLTELETGAEKTTEKIEQIVTDLDTKAPDTVLFNVSTLERKVSTIEVHLRKEEEQGIGVSERACAWVLLNRLRYFAWHGRESPLRDFFRAACEIRTAFIYFYCTVYVRCMYTNTSCKLFCVFLAALCLPPPRVKY